MLLVSYNTQDYSNIPLVRHFLNWYSLVMWFQYFASIKRLSSSFLRLQIYFLFSWMQCVLFLSRICWYLLSREREYRRNWNRYLLSRKREYRRSLTIMYSIWYNTKGNKLYMNNISAVKVGCVWIMLVILGKTDITNTF